MATIQSLNGVLTTDIAAVNGIPVAEIAKFNNQDWPALGPSWNKVLTLTGQSFGACAIDGTNFVAGCANQPEIWYSAGGTGTWTECAYTFPAGDPYGGSTDGFRSLLFQPDDDYLIAGTYDGGGSPQLYKSTDHGVSWTSLYPGPGFSDELDTRGQYGLAYDSVSGYIFAGTGRNGFVLRSTDDGATWLPEMQNIADLNEVHTIYYDGTNDVLLLGGGENKAAIWKSTNDGVTWIFKQDFALDATPPGTPNIDAYVFTICHDPVYDTRIAGAGRDHGQIWLSDDIGETWTKQKDLYNDSFEHQVLCSCYDIARGRLYVGTGGTGELWYSEDGGYTWTKELALLETDDVNQITDIKYDPSTEKILFCTSSSVGTFDGTLWIYG